MATLRNLASALIPEPSLSRVRTVSPCSPCRLDALYRVTGGGSIQLSSFGSVTVTGGVTGFAG